MAAIHYIVIDKDEKRHTICAEFETFMDTVGKNPRSIREFDQMYTSLAEEPLFEDGNRPNLSVDAIVAVMGRYAQESDEEVLDRWKQASAFERSNYGSFAPDEQTEYDIPDLTAQLAEDADLHEVFARKWDDLPQEFQRVIRRRMAPDRGVIVVDLRKKEVRYLSDGGFDISGEEYRLPPDWKLIEE